MTVAAGPGDDFERGRVSSSSGLPWQWSRACLHWVAGWRGAALVPLGALVIWGGPQVLRALWPEIPFGEVNLRFIPAYLVTLAGMGLVLYSFVVAYRIGNEKVAVETLIAETALPGEVATLGD